jgi:predicted transcriptional regulator
MADLPTMSPEECRQQFYRDALAAWEEYQSTGQHLTGAEADAWLARLEAGDDVDPPPLDD